MRLAIFGCTLWLCVAAAQTQPAAESSNPDTTVLTKMAPHISAA